MADPRLVVPYRDPYDSPLDPSFFNMGNPTLGDLSNMINGPTALPQQNHHGVAEGSQYSPYQDDLMIQNNFVHNNIPSGGVGNFEAGPSQVYGDQVQPSNEDVGSQNYIDVMALPNWPEPPIPFACSCCQLLRDMVHTNGIQFTKLEIHGRIGIICHAIQCQSICGDSSSSSPQYQMFDFSNKSIEDVKSFLVQYCMQQNVAGYYILQDPLSAYYETLCIGLDWTEELNEDLVDWIPNPGLSADDDDMELEAENGRTPRASLAEQRERSGKMTLSDLSDYFHLPINEAAREVNLCCTVVKKICRKAGLKRWPHRKVKSIAKQISLLKRDIYSVDPVVRARTQAQIRILEQQMMQHCAGVAPTGLNIP